MSSSPKPDCTVEIEHAHNSTSNDNDNTGHFRRFWRIRLLTLCDYNMCVGLFFRPENIEVVRELFRTRGQEAQANDKGHVSPANGGRRQDKPLRRQGPVSRRMLEFRRQPV